MTITTREAIAEDYDALLAVYTEVDALHRENHPELFKRPEDAARARSYIEENLVSPDKGLFVAEASGRVIGFAECYVQKASAFPVIREREWVQLDNIAVLKEYQHHHAGTFLLQAVIRWAREKSLHRVELKVYDFNTTAHAFYQERGFRPLLHALYLDL